MVTRLQQLASSPLLRHLALGAILAGGLLAGLETSAFLTGRFGAWMVAADRLILAIFLAEIGIRLAAHAPRVWVFFKDPWNTFDFIIVLLCCLPAVGPFAALLRLARVLRLLRLVSALPGLQLLVGALLKSLKQMGYVGLLLGLIFYVYGVAGVHLFGKNDPLHFGNLAVALMTLFKVITLENWSTIFEIQYHGADIIGYEGRAHLLATPQASPWGATVYFVTFILLGTMIILNLFIGIIMNSMSEMHAEIALKEREQTDLQTGPNKARLELEDMESQLKTLQQKAIRLRHLIGGDV